MCTESASTVTPNISTKLLHPWRRSIYLANGKSPSTSPTIRSQLTLPIATPSGSAFPTASLGKISLRNRSLRSLTLSRSWQSANLTREENQRTTLVRGMNPLMNAADVLQVHHEGLEVHQDVCAGGRVEIARELCARNEVEGEAVSGSVGSGAALRRESSLCGLYLFI